MPKNKPQNLEELIEKSIKELFYWGKEKYRLNPTEDEIRVALREVAEQTLDAVRVEEMEIKTHNYYGDDVCDACVDGGFNSAIKAQEKKVREWLGEGGNNRE